jgi:hypothetical protein
VHVTLPDNKVVTVDKNDTSSTFSDHGSYYTKNSSGNAGKIFFTVTKDRDDGTVTISPGVVDGEFDVITSLG